MASRPSPKSLIHCAVCGEDYSATYKRCPFCGAKNAPSASPNPPRRAPAPPPVYDDEPEPAPSRRAPADPDDTYVFDGQDLFDEDPEEDYRPVRPKGGKRCGRCPDGIRGRPGGSKAFRGKFGHLLEPGNGSCIYDRSG